MRELERAQNGHDVVDGTGAGAGDGGEKGGEQIIFRHDFVGDLEPHFANLCFCFCHWLIPTITFTDQWLDGETTMGKCTLWP